MYEHSPGDVSDRFLIVLQQLCCEVRTEGCRVGQSCFGCPARMQTLFCLLEQFDVMDPVVCVRHGSS